MNELDLKDYKYIKWEELFKEDFIPKYNTLEKLKKDKASADDIVNAYISLFNSAIDTIKWFLANNGIYKFEVKDIIRQCYYIEFFSNGRTWLEAAKLVKMSDENHVRPILFIYAGGEYFKIFEELKEKFEERLENE